MTATIRDNPEESRYELVEAGTLLGFVTYQRQDHQIALTHTNIDPSHRGGGRGRELVAGVLADVRRRGLSVLPYCPYVRSVVAREAAQHLDLVPPVERERFGLTAPDTA